MTTQPTKNPVPSELPRDLKYNAGKIDEFTNSLAMQYIDRFGQAHYTIEGLKSLVLQQIYDLGWVPVGTFQAGAKILAAGSVIQDSSTGIWYRWDDLATIPKTVPPSSTPESTGGVGEGKWIAVDISEVLRKQLSEKTGANLVGFSQLASYQAGTVGNELKSIRVTSSSLGLSTSNSDAASNAIVLNNKLQQLYTAGVREIYMDVSYPVDPGYDYDNYIYSRRVLHLPDFRFYGPGKFSGLPSGLYNVSVEDKLCSEPVLVNGSNIQIRKQPKTNIKVVFFGDSISLDWADSLTLGICQSSVIKAELQAQNPGYTFTFVNRAIGGQTWINANTKPSAFPSWYADTSKNWVDYINDESPDIIVMAFGMNDHMGFNMGTMASTVNKLRAGSPYAHFVMCTCMVPSRSSAYNNGVSFDGLGFQEGRNFAAGAERTYAQFTNMSVWDFNRYYVQCRDGKDQVACELQEISATPTNGAYSAPQCVDFAFEALISGWNKTTPIYVNCGGDTSEDFIYVGSDGSGNFQVSARTEYIDTYFSLNTGIAIPNGNFWLVITVLNNECHVYIGTNASAPVRDGTPNTLLSSFRMIRHGGITNPKIGTGGTLSGNVSQIRVMLGLPTQRKKTITDREMWGEGDSTPNRKAPYGGNGINHPSAQGLARIITPVMQAQNLKINFSDLSLNVLMKANVSTYLTVPSAKLVNGILFLKGGVMGSGVTQGATIATIDRWSGFGQADYLVGTLGVDSGSAWGARVLRIKSNGDIVCEVGGGVAGILFNNISVVLA
ncbi:hypothetical protein [Pantoea eucrina]|uniref:tail fiber/spike domain-containing protein n=1 Tax=Pantoea eucrina TaxID=472693 RepID=UPI001CC4716D|nr:hypothetical protein [Pantoea eucrina]UBB12334.1 hypothetical protein LAC65_10895 [Pantoea eucrina]